MGPAPMSAMHYADEWGRTAVTVLRTLYPYAAQHIALGPDDNDVTPERLHPAFHGSYDWHSSVHMHWSAVTLLTGSTADLAPDTQAALTELMDQRLTPERIAVEAAYLRERPTWERPYGWAWAAILASAASASPVARERGWAAATAPLLDVVGDLLLDWLPRLAYPVRSGEHSNVAFGLALCHEAMTAAGRRDVAALIERRATFYYGGDRDAPVTWEPGGSDFLSPSLSEADLMRRVLDPADFTGWLAAYLPRLGNADDPLLRRLEVSDPTDGKGAHLLGLTLSRSWQLRLLAGHLRDDARARIEARTEEHIREVERFIVAAGFMATHWLVSFALLAASAAPPSAEPRR